MYAVELDRSKRLLVISAGQRVTAEQAKLAAQRVRELVQDVAPGFRVLADFRWLESMDSASGASRCRNHGCACRKRGCLRDASDARSAQGYWSQYSLAISLRTRDPNRDVPDAG